MVINAIPIDINAAKTYNNQVTSILYAKGLKILIIRKYPIGIAITIATTTNFIKLDDNSDIRLGIVAPKAFLY